MRDNDKQMDSRWRGCRGMVRMLEDAVGKDSE